MRTIQPFRPRRTPSQTDKPPWRASVPALALRRADLDVVHDHPPPHFHAYYGSDMAIIEIETLRVLSGRVPRRALAMVLEWAGEHREELRRDWLQAEGHRPLAPITPLE